MVFSIIITTLFTLTAIANPVIKVSSPTFAKTELQLKYLSETTQSNPDSCAVPVAEVTRMGIAPPQMIWQDVVASCLAQIRETFARALRRDRE